MCIDLACSLFETEFRGFRIVKPRFLTLENITMKSTFTCVLMKELLSSFLRFDPPAWTKVTYAI